MEFWMKSIHRCGKLFLPSSHCNYRTYYSRHHYSYYYVDGIIGLRWWRRCGANGNWYD